MKKETLEEAAERINCESNIPYDITNELIAMAKWQAERMYSEEKVVNCIQYTLDNFFNGNLSGLNSKEIFESCKKVLEDRDKKAERMYSEEDMIEFSEWVSFNFPNQHNYLRALQKYNQGLDVPKERLVGYCSTIELFEQFKKK